MFAGLIAFRRNKLRISKIKFALFGLWNFLTLIGFIIATLFLRTKRLNAELEQELRSQGLKVSRWDHRKIGFILLFTMFFITLNFTFIFILKAVF